jgi:acetolactate synthase-1/2/3 large subunit
MIAGQIPRAAIGKGFGLLHEVIDQLDAVAPVTKWRRRVLEVAAIPEAVREAMRQLRTGRPRPVEIEIPPEAMEEDGDAVLLDPAPAERPAAGAAAVDVAATLLAGSVRPVIYAGGGVHAADAHEALAAVAAFLQAGVVQSPEGKGAISDRHPLSLGSAVWPGSPLREYLDQADVVLAVGTRLAVGLDPAQHVVHVDIDPDEIGRAAPRPSREAALAALRARAASTGVLEPQASILRSLRAGTPDDAIVVMDMTQIGYYARPFWPVYAPRTYLTPSYSGNLGFAFPTALGAKVARPDRPVVAVVGDGGFLFTVQELATAVQHRINVVVAVFNDHAYGNVARDMDESWGGTIGTDLHNPDFMKLAEAFGAAGLRARDPADVGALVRQALALDRPAIVEVPVGRMSEPPYRTPRQVPATRRRR